MVRYSRKQRSHLGLMFLAGAATFLSFQGVAKTTPQDHPAFDPMPGAVIKDYDAVDYEVATLILSKPYEKNNRAYADETLELEGKLTHIHYILPKKYSSLQTFRNYQKLAKRQGMDVLYTCERTCYRGNLGDFDELIQNHRGVYLNGSEEIQYFAAQKGNLYLSLFVNVMQQRTHVWQFVIEAGEVNDDLLSPMAYELQASGSIDLYGIYFDSGKSTLKAESSSELAELAEVLQQFPDLNIEIIGHTDSNGSSLANEKLSLKRAQAVRKQLNVQHAVASNRLQAEGLGESMPVADNSTKEGRAKNRRVEIVAINPEVLSPNAAIVHQDALHNSADTIPEDKEAEGSEFDELVENVEKASKLGNALKSFF
ncbi:OmpA family protein [Vibrio sp. qd031]|uniref:OmpA family protein n=1 Tax=Vibrio sp. qd031 TaxID=1603038 RepID=UPI000A0F6A43|nr:OmpA family protein [Vibrio sp. qd031]